MWRWLKIVSITLGVGLLAWAAVFPHVAGGRQFMNLRIAENEVPDIRARVHSDERFQSITIATYTGQDGAIWVVGQVKDDAEALRVRELVESAHPTVAVKYDVRVLSRE